MAEKLLITPYVGITEDGASEARIETPAGLSFQLSGFSDRSINVISLGQAETVTIPTANALFLCVYSLDAKRFSIKLNDADDAQLDNQLFFMTAVDAASRNALGANLDVRLIGNGSEAAKVGWWTVSEPSAS